MRVLIIGGYGTFGARLVKRLADDPALTLYVAGRNFGQAQRLCESVFGSAALIPIKLDKRKAIGAQLDVRPDVIIDAAGPFQNAMPENSAAIKYALDHGLVYLDLSDDSEWTAQIRALDTRAEAAGATLIPGLSTYPVLTAAALRELETHIGQAQQVWAGIAPSPRQPMGRNVIAAITAQAGEQRARERRCGQTRMAYGLTRGLSPVVIRPPGQIPLGPLHFVNVDSPGAEVLPDHVEGMRSFAGPRPRWALAVLRALARLRAKRIFPPLRYLTDGIFHAQGLLRIGDPRSGMIVSACAEDGRRAVWHLIAQDPDGPNIPVIPAQIIMQRLAGGAQLKPGAYHAVGLMSLDAFRTAWSDLKIHDGVRLTETEDTSLYHRILGLAYSHLPPAIQKLHDVRGPRRWAGQAQVTRGRNPLANIVAGIFRFPKSAAKLPVILRYDLNDGVERWERKFGSGPSMVSTQEAGRGKYEGLVIERFGPIAVRLAIVKDGARLRNVARGWSLFGLPLPRALCPGGDIFEHEQDGRFHFHVDIRAPLLGRLVKYDGWLEPAD